MKKNLKLRNTSHQAEKNPDQRSMSFDSGLSGMRSNNMSVSGCALLGRRQFITRLGLAGGAAITFSAGIPSLTIDSHLFDLSTKSVLSPPVLPGDSGVKPRIRVAFSRAKDEYFMGWPGAAYDHKANQVLYSETMLKAATRLGIDLDIEHEPLRDTDNAQVFLRKSLDTGVDGALLVVMNLNDGWPMIQHFVDGKGNLPTVIFAPHGTQFTPRLKPFRDTPNCFLGSTEDVEWLGSALHLLKVVWQMKNTRIAVIENNRVREQILNPLGTSLVQLPLERFAEAYDATQGSKEAEAIARKYMENAQEIVEPTKETIIDAARNYLANRRIMHESNCHAVTMDCLGMVEKKRTPPPCMAYMQLLNERTCGCCERDINAALSLMLSSYLFGKPGFMHNPTPNTVLNNYGGAHCVAPTLLDGFDGNESKYLLRTHHESDWGVAPQVLLRENQPATVMKFLSPDTLIAATGTILHNIDTRPGNGVGGCRTSFQMAMDNVPNVRDIRGHHNLLVYGKHTNELRAWGQLSGVNVEHITSGPL